MSDPAALTVALLALAASLAAAVRRPPWAPEAAVATLGAGLLVVLGAIDPAEARDALAGLAPTVGFLAALLVLAEGCRRERLFDAIGSLLAARARGEPRRLLALVFLAASAVTAALSLDATIVLLTPVVLVTARRLGLPPRPHLFACAHLANSASLLLPISNLTSLLAVRASGLSFVRFATLMTLPTLVVIAVEWLVFSRFFSADLRSPPQRQTISEAMPLPPFPLLVVGLTLAGFVASGPLAIEPVWAAFAGAAVVSAPAVLRRGAEPIALLRAAEPGFLVFVLALGVIVATASHRGLGDAVDAFVPGREGLPDLLLIALVGAVLANIVNNVPATLILVPVAAAVGPGAVLAMLIGVNVGPNLTYVGSLATLLWRRILRREAIDVDGAEFFRLAVRTVPAGLVGATLGLWVALQLVGI